MATFAPPVHRDKFLYSSILYADAGNDNHHPRASVAELTALLRPEVVNSKAKKIKTQTKTQCPEGDGEVKDWPWHFWTAQLLHYGLTATKDKNAAKVRLLSALNGEKLEVPGWIQRLEGELKKEWEAENRKLKKAAKGDGVPKLGKSGELDGSKNVSTKKASANTVAVSGKAKSTTSKRKRDGVSPLESSKKAKVKNASKDMVSSPLTKKNSAKPPASQKPPSPEEPWPASYRKAVAHDAWKFYDVDHLAHTRPPNAPHPRPYRVSCPDAEMEWEQKTIPEFYLAFSATEDEWWSRFKWGAFEGILILQRQPKRVNKAIGVPFKWRANYAFGNEDGDGEGKIFFDSASTIRGEFHNFFREKPCHFRAEAIQSAPQPPQISQGTPVLDQMRIEWSQMPTTMHDAPTKKSARVKKENNSQTLSSPPLRNLTST
ncbi:hypothetical protein EKO04_007142 [Ascochyta lentis]|uniref:Uncharacterized protein n=1 Tax=Ascochyta lentis TaxID=205686 RepID=A0A8H7J0U7_9PLEO|nr:hypothetical protein EKO04_007142 [Ascochyta lentis]